MIRVITNYQVNVKDCKNSSLMNDFNTFTFIACTIIAFGIIFGGYTDHIVQYTVLPAVISVAIFSMIQITCYLLSHKHKCTKVIRKEVLYPKSPARQDRSMQTSPASMPRLMINGKEPPKNPTPAQVPRTLTPMACPSMNATSCRSEISTTSATPPLSSGSNDSSLATDDASSMINSWEVLPAEVGSPAP